MLDPNTKRLLRALSASTPAAESTAGVLGALAGPILRATTCASLEVWLQDDARVQRWRVAPGEAQRAFPAPELVGSDGIATRGARALGRRDLLDSAQRTATGGLWSPREALLPFAVAAPVEGVLHVLSHPERALDVRHVEHADVLASALGSKLRQQQVQAALTERVKELTCVYRIAQIAAAPGALDDALDQIVKILPAAWLEPAATSARISLDERAFHSADFRVSDAVLRAPIASEGQAVGWVEVFHEVCDDAAPFLPEEQSLLDAVARELGSLIERKRAETDRARLQERLHHADRLATIGRLAAGVAHELNEPLASILGFAQLASKAPELSDSTREDVERVVKASLHARDVIRNLLVFSRQSPQRRAEVAVQAPLEQAIALVEPRCAGAAVRLSQRIPDDLPRIQADPSQLQQVFLNLLVNAVQAMPDGGELDVVARHTADAVCVSIRDSGVGVAPEHLERIFLPFFTTKDVGEGTGLGLSVVHGIVAAHEGAVNVTSELGRGTCFEVVLPRAVGGEAR